jgi:hypothetical protein
MRAANKLPAMLSGLKPAIDALQKIFLYGNIIFTYFAFRTVLYVYP